MYRYIYAFIFGFGIHASSAQNASVTGTITDTASVAVGYATVAVFDLRDSSVLNFGLTDEEGGFELHRLPAQVPLRLLVSHVLFHSQTLNFRLDSNHQFLDIDTVRMNLKHNELAEAMVTWEAPPILVRNDTIEFNADAFIGRPGSVVEDLLKRIPGLEIAEDGTMTVNGRKVRKITLDSKEFFGEDPEIMLKNIPARAIEKVQVTEEKDQHGRTTESGEVTINLTLKPWAKKSHFGKAYGGYGTDNRYEGGAIWNFLRDTLQISVLGYSNNLSQSGFSYSDLYKLGGFDRSGVGSTIYYSDGRVAMDGAQFGGGNGITTSHGGGFNLNYDIPAKLKLSASYFFGAVQTDYRSSRHSQTFFSDSTLHSFTGVSQYLNGYSHVARANLVWFPDTVQQINLVPVISYRNGATDKTNNTWNGYSLDPGKQSLINNQYQNSYGQFEFKNELNWYRDFAKWNHSLLTRQSYLQNEGDGGNTIFQSRFDPDSFVRQEDFQRQELSQMQHGFSLNQSYLLARPRTDTNQISFQTTYEIADLNKTVEVYEIDSSGEQGLFLPALSTHFRERREQIGQQISLGRKLKNGATLRLSGSFQLWNLYLNNALNANELDRRFTFMNGSFLYNRSNSEKDLYLSLSTGMNLPESSDLLDLRDNSDPNRIQMGNPSLQAYRSNRLFLWMRGSGTSKKRGWSLYSSIGHTTNAVVRESYYDEAGRIITRPVNLENGKNQLSGNISWSFYQTIKTSREWSHRPRVRWYSGGSSSWTPVNEVLYQSESFSFGPDLSYTLSKKEYLDLSFGYDVYAAFSRLVKLNDWRMTIGHEISTEIWWAPVEKIWLEAKCEYTYQTFSSGNLPARQFTLLNLSVTRLVLKENRGQLRLSVFDVLGQNQALYRSATQNQIVLTESNAVTRYLMLSFVYNFNSFNEKGRKRRGFEFW